MFNCFTCCRKPNADELARRAAAAEAALATTRSEKDQLATDLRTANEQAQAASQAAQKTIAALEMQKKQAEDQARKLAAQVATLGDQLGQRDTQIAQLQSERILQPQAELRARRLEERTQELESQLKQRDAQIAQLQSERIPQPQQPSARSSNSSLQLDSVELEEMPRPHLSIQVADSYVDTTDRDLELADAHAAQLVTSLKDLLAMTATPSNQSAAQSPSENREGKEETFQALKAANDDTIAES